MATVLPSRQHFAAQTFELQMKRRRIMAVVAIVVLLELSLIGLSPFANWTMSDADAQGDVWRQVLMIGTLGMLFLAPANARPPMAVPVSILVLLGYCLLSCTWAIDPYISLRRLAYTAIVIWILVRAIGDLGAVRTLNVLRAALVAMLVINYLVVIFSPYGKHMATVTEAESLIGNWRGIIFHKNVTGALCALTVLMFTFDRGRLPAWLNVPVIVASAFFLFMSQSKTSMAVLPIALLAGAIMRLYNPRHRSLVLPLALMAGLVAIMAMTTYLGVITSVLDDPTALTGRAAIWPLLIEYAGEHLWTGAGYMSFWQIGPASPIWSLTSSWVAAAGSHGHNGYLDTLVTIGLPGLLLTVVVLYVWPGLRLLYSTGISRTRRALLVSLMVFSAGHNMTESTMLDRAAIVHVFLMIAVILIHRLSSQSAGAHQTLRARMVRLADRGRLKMLRSGPRRAA